MKKRKFGLTLLFIFTTLTLFGRDIDLSEAHDSNCDSIAPFKFQPAMSVIMENAKIETYNNVSDGDNSKFTFEYKELFICFSRGNFGIVSKDNSRLLPSIYDSITSNGIVVIAYKKGMQTVYSANLVEKIVDSCSNFVYDPHYLVYSNKFGRTGVQLIDKPYNVPFIFDSITIRQGKNENGKVNRLAFCYLNDSIRTFRWDADSLWETKSFASKLRIQQLFREYIIVQNPENEKYGALDLLLEFVVPTNYEELDLLRTSDHGLLLCGRNLKQFDFLKHDTLLGHIIADSVSRFTDLKSVLAIQNGSSSIFDFSGQKLTTHSFDRIVAYRGKYLYQLGNAYGIFGENYEPIDNEIVILQEPSFKTLDEIESALLEALLADDEEPLRMFCQRLMMSYPAFFDLLVEGKFHFIQKMPSKILFDESYSEFYTALVFFKEKLCRKDHTMETLKIIGFENADFTLTTDNYNVHTSPLVVEISGEQYNFHLGKLLKLDSGIYSMTLPKSFKR